MDLMSFITPQIAVLTIGVLVLLVVVLVLVNIALKKDMD
jgi:hypothetical protein